ncbi:uncharacterized protein LOC142987127 [Anticarsia gemmatalis]|uniref:uncharacterized protein LOC142987127 n=1 Tax=Anticarsia gemmatalis TaxID=129554 RepID=UPI003F762843
MRMCPSVVDAVVQLLAVACVLLAAAEPGNAAPDVTTDVRGTCYNALSGFQTNKTRPFTYALAPQTSTFDIVIPEFKGCSVRGVSVAVCERGGAAAHVLLQGTQRARVTRTGDLSAPARADFLIYCA